MGKSVAFGPDALTLHPAAPAADLLRPLKWTSSLKWTISLKWTSSQHLHYYFLIYFFNRWFSLFPLDTLRPPPPCPELCCPCLSVMHACI